MILVVLQGGSRVTCIMVQYFNSGVFAENLVGLVFLHSFSYIKPILTHEKLFAVGKKSDFSGLGWP